MKRAKKIKLVISPDLMEESPHQYPTSQNTELMWALGRSDTRTCQGIRSFLEGNFCRYLDRVRVRNPGVWVG